MKLRTFITVGLAAMLMVGCLSVTSMAASKKVTVPTRIKAKYTGSEVTTTTTFKRDAKHRISVIKDVIADPAYGFTQTTKLTYNKKGLVVKAKYTMIGEGTEVKGGKSVEVKKFTYNKKGYIVRSKVTSSTESDPGIVEKFTYNKKNQIKKVVTYMSNKDVMTTTTYKYDSKGRISIIKDKTDSGAYYTKYKYSNGKKTRKTYMKSGSAAYTLRSTETLKYKKVSLKKFKYSTKSLISNLMIIEESI